MRRKFGKREYEVIFKADADLNYERKEGNYLFRAADLEAIASLLQKISENSWALVDLSMKQSALEEMYVDIMEKE
ncbi:MAG: hypothetical protein WC749_08375 [Dehalococcoidia bacterium]